MIESGQAGNRVKSFSNNTVIKCDKSSKYLLPSTYISIFTLKTFFSTLDVKSSQKDFERIALLQLYQAFLLERI